MATVSKRSWTARDGGRRSAWVVSYYDHQGHQHRLQYRNKREADEERVRVEGELAGGVHVADRDSISVLVAAQAFLADFESLVAAGKRERSTVDAYRRHVCLHVAPYVIASTKLSRLTGPVCLAYAQELESNLSDAMARRVFATVRLLLNFAVAHGWCGDNPAKSVQIRLGTREAENDETSVATAPPKDEVRLLLRTAAQHGDHGKVNAVVRLLTFCGLRASELGALRRQDIDFATNRMNVRQRADAWQRIGPCKSKAGRRCIPVPPATAQVLKQWVLAAPVSALDLVFPTGAGTVESYANLYHRLWVPLMTEAGLMNERPDGTSWPRFALHALRHVACSLWIEQGGTAKQVQTWAGHASVQFTLDRYGHLWEDAVGDKAMALAIERSLSEQG